MPESSYAALLLRLCLGAIYLAHGLILKVMTFGMANTAQYFDSLGLPASFAYLVVAAEVGGGVLLILGIKTRWVALALTPVLMGAIWVHSGNGWVFSAAGGGWEFPVFLLLASLVQALLGDGALAVTLPRRLRPSPT